jgi:hypothetical protein
VAIVVVIFLLGGFLLEHPNSVTHKCEPNVRTVMGLSSEGYPYEKHFCEEGYYPVLKWGQAQIENSAVELFVILIPALLLLPVIFILANQRKKKGD